MEKKYFRTEITFVVLSERPIGDMDLATVVLECNAGEFVGNETRRDAKSVSISTIREEVVEAGSEPGFFQLDIGTTDSSRVIWLEGLDRGDRVQWNDPADGLASGRGTIVSIASDSGEVENTETIISLQMDNGGEAEALCTEIEPIKSPREDFLTAISKHDKVKCHGRICEVEEFVVSHGDPETWVFEVSAPGGEGQPKERFEATGFELQPLAKKRSSKPKR